MTPQIATITGKRQLTIPASIFRHVGFKKGQKVLVSVENEHVKVESVLNLVEKLAGSIKVPKEFKGSTTEKIIEKAKKKYFANKST